MSRSLDPRSPHDGKYGWTEPNFLLWLASRPASVQKLIEEFPMGTVLTIKGDDWYVIGWGEGDSISVSPIWIGDDYEGAIAMRQRLHIHHVQDGEVKVKRFTAD